MLGRAPLGLWIKRMTSGTSTTELARDRARDLGPQRSSQAVEEVDPQSADFQPVHPSAATSRSLCRPRRGDHQEGGGAPRAPPTSTRADVSARSRGSPTAHAAWSGGHPASGPLQHPTRRPRTGSNGGSSRRSRSEAASDDSWRWQVPQTGDSSNGDMQPPPCQVRGERQGSLHGVLDVRHEVEHAEVRQGPVGGVQCRPATELGGPPGTCGAGHEGTAVPSDSSGNNDGGESPKWWSSYTSESLYGRLSRLQQQQAATGAPVADRRSSSSAAGPDRVLGTTTEPSGLCPGVQATETGLEPTVSEASSSRPDSDDGFPVETGRYHDAFNADSSGPWPNQQRANVSAV